MAEKINGTISRVLLSKGFAFALGDDGVSRFLHASDFTNRSDFDKLHEGQHVRFFSVDFNSPEKKGNGLRGMDVEVIRHDT